MLTIFFITNSEKHLITPIRHQSKSYVDDRCMTERGYYIVVLWPQIAFILTEAEV